MESTHVHDTDVVILDHNHLAAFVSLLGEPGESTPTLLTEDEFTRGRAEFNLICYDNGEYGIATQLRNPLDPADVVIDLRDTHQPDFSDYLLGLA